MNLVRAFIEESSNFNAAAAAETLITDLLESNIFTARNWFTDDEIDGLDMAGLHVWYINREGYVSASTFDDDGEEVNWIPIAMGTWSDRIYVREGQIRHTARTNHITPPDMIVICS